MSPRQLNLRGASCWLDLLLPVLTQEQILMRVSQTIPTQWPLRKLRPYVEILKALTIFDVLPDEKRNFGVNWNLLDYGTLLKIMVEILHNVKLCTNCLLHTNCWRLMTQVISDGKRCHVSWCQQNTNDVMRITRRMIRQLNSLVIYIQLSNCMSSITNCLFMHNLKHGRNRESPDERLDN